MTISPLTVAKDDWGALNVSLDYLAGRNISDWPGLLADSRLSFAIRAANLIWAGPPSGADTAPSWRALVTADIPSLDASKITTGQLALARGGTGADLSGTGGANKIVKQSSAGAALTVAALGAGDVPDAALTANVALLNRDPQTFAGNTLLVKTITAYNNIATIQNGVPSEYGAQALSAQAANAGPVTIYTTPASPAFMYRVSYYIWCSTVGGGADAITMNVLWDDGSGALTYTDTALSLTAHNARFNVLPLLVGGSKTIQFQTTGGVFAGGGKYSLATIVEAM